MVDVSREKMADLPKDKTLGDSAFLFWRENSPLRKRGGGGDFPKKVSD